MVALFLTFSGTSILFYIELYKFTFPPVAHKGSFITILSPSLVISYLFDNSHSDRCEVISRGFDLHFPED